jgi:hypothetical protein
MPPFFLLLGVGKQARFPLPLPIVLLWPFIILGWILLFLTGLFLPPHSRTGRGVRFARTGLTLFMRLSGLKVAVTTADGTAFYFWFI